MVTAKEITQRAGEDGIEFISLQFTDIVGVVKSVTIPIAELDAALETGVWFDGSSVEGFARIAESDMYLVPDLDTYAVIPWERDSNPTARLICDVYTPEGTSFEVIPAMCSNGSCARPQRRAGSTTPDQNQSFSCSGGMATATP
jgi:glutamine synthetase